MKRFWLSLILILLMAVNLFGQSNDSAAFKHVVKLIRRDNVAELSKIVVYPLKRKNPLPDIANAEAFKKYYKYLFDKSFKKRLMLFKHADVVESNGYWGLVGGSFIGDIWMNEQGKITAVNYSSKGELALRADLTAKIKKQIYPTVNKWDDNILVAKSQKLTIGVDWISDTKAYRYVSWSGWRSIAEKPDLILYHGKPEAQGSMGGWTYTSLTETGLMLLTMLKFVPMTDLEIAAYF